MTPAPGVVPGTVEEKTVLQEPEAESIPPEPAAPEGGEPRPEDSGREPTPEPEPPPPSQPQVKEFTVTARQFTFEPNTITVKKGDTVRLHVTSVDVTHGIAISQFGVNALLPPGQTKTVEFVASKSGTYQIFCSLFCGSGHLSMKGTLIVE